MHTIFIYRDKERACLVHKFDAEGTEAEAVRLAEHSLATDYSACQGYQVENAQGDILAVGHRR